MTPDDELYETIRDTGHLLSIESGMYPMSQSFNRFSAQLIKSTDEQLTQQLKMGMAKLKNMKFFGDNKKLKGY